ncbi:hypothetical protein GEMRC1_006602 [Eukaryota sp. GEM-RC1]
MSLDCSRNINKTRTKFKGSLVGNSDSLSGHCFRSPEFGGIGFSKVKYLREGAFLGCPKNILDEFRARFKDCWTAGGRLSSSKCFLLLSLKNFIKNLAAEVWSSLFPVLARQIPRRSIFSLPMCVRKFQKKFIYYQFKSSLAITTLKIALA